MKIYNILVSYLDTCDRKEIASIEYKYLGIDAFPKSIIPLVLYVQNVSFGFKNMQLQLFCSYLSNYSYSPVLNYSQVIELQCLNIYILYERFRCDRNC
ncbi:unnamed protein product [Cunninghamella echinulata]